jgi:deoxycytidylate deaminase
MIELAIQQARKSTHTKARVGAVIFSKKTVISVAYNKPFALSKRLAARFHSSLKVGIHAEAAAILRARTDLRGAEMLVVRIGRSGVLRLSKPCPWCAAYIQYVGIKSVTYSDESGGFTTMRI